MEKIHPATKQSERELLMLIRRSLMIADPHVAVQRKSTTVYQQLKLRHVSLKQQAA